MDVGGPKRERAMAAGIINGMGFRGADVLRFYSSGKLNEYLGWRILINITIFVIMSIYWGDGKTFKWKPARHGLSNWVKLVA